MKAVEVKSHIGKYRILCVDDQKDVIEIAEVCLSLDPELEVRSCNSGAEALKLMKSWRPDLVLMDVMMPDMDGPTTMMWMEKMVEVSGVPVAFLTAHSDLETASKLKALGAAAVITKPFQLRLLAAQVRGILKTIASES